MMDRKIRVAPDAVALSRLAAQEVVRRASLALAQRGRFALALAGGSTPKRLYALLAEPPFSAEMPWSQTEVFFGDERHVRPDDPESNYGMARDALFSRVPIPTGNVHRIRGEEPSAEAAAQDYERELRNAFGLARTRDVPRLDLILLGMGEDGHTASLFPGNPALEERERLVVAPFVERLQAHRITVTLPVVEAARGVVFLVSGRAKAHRVAEVLAGPGDSLPAGHARPDDGELIWLLDAGAAALLPGAEASR
ncbi:MAG TPA: 6-phosphogluconolactonase [Anaeromyxobacteraceae bacterium]|nr:6-phosphogluconolactonase [Anaeromyxobacteraceae bacterium]